MRLNMEANVKKKKARVASTIITLSATSTSTLATTTSMTIAASTLAWHCF